jgi:predicted nucleic acid-binding Zn ribbon protein
MRKSETQNIAEILKQLTSTLHLDKKLSEHRMINTWQEVVGTLVAKNTREIYIKDRVLFVHLSSSIVRSELMMIRSGLIKALNDKAGAKVIDEIVIK